MSSAVSALIPQLANYNPSGFALKNQQLQGEIGLNAAQTAAEQARVPYIQQQTAGLAQEQAIKQQSLQDAQIVRQAYMNTDGKPENITPYLLKNGISGTGLMGWQQHAYDLLSKAQTYTKEQTENEERLHNLAGNVVDSLSNVKDDGEMQRSYQQQLPTLQREAPDIQWKPQVTRDDLSFYSGVLGHAKAVLEQAKTKAETVKTQQETSASAATQAKTEAEMPEVEAKGKIAQAEAAALNMDPKAIKGMVDGSIDPAKYPDQNQRTLNDAANAVRLGLGAKGVQAAIKDGSDRISQRENAIEQAQVTRIPFQEMRLENQRFQQLQESYRFHAGELDKLAQPEMQLGQRIQRLNDTVSQNSPQADALIAPELLSVMSGGQGSGLRMNQTEINQIIGGRSKWEDLKTAINKWSLDPKTANSILPEQRQQIHALVDAVTARAQQRQQIVMSARSALAGATGPEQHKAIVADAQNKLTQAIAEKPASGGEQGIPSAVQSVLSKVGPGIHTLSDGSKWMKAADGTISKQ